MHRELVARRGWIGEQTFMRALNFCMLLPGPEATQLATFVGWRLHGTLGGVAAGTLFVLPSVFVLLVLSYAVAAYGEVPLVSALLYGVQPVVVAIVLDALLRIGGRTLRHPVLLSFAGLAYLAVQVFSVPFPLVVVVAAIAGVLLARSFPLPFGESQGSAAPVVADHGRADHDRTERPRIATTIAVFVLLWAAPVGALWLWRGAGDVLVHEALFFTQAAFVTFGGAYAVLAYIADAAVHGFGWLTEEQMVQGLGLAESTPGPLIMVTQYVGFLAAWKLHPEAPLANGVLGALVTTYTTFLPSFLFIFLGAPYVERLGTAHRARAALVGVTAAVVGVIGRLATFFGTSVFLDGARVDVYAVAVTVVSFAALRWTRLPILVLVPVGALLGAVWRLGAF